MTPSKLCQQMATSYLQTKLTLPHRANMSNRNVTNLILSHIKSLWNKFTFTIYIRLWDIHSKHHNLSNSRDTYIKVMCIIYKCRMGKYIWIRFLFFRQHGGRWERGTWRHIKGLQQPQQEFTRPDMRFLGDLWYWALVLVTAPCFCRRWSLSWLLCLKWRSHFSQW